MSLHKVLKNGGPSLMNSMFGDINVLLFFACCYLLTNSVASGQSFDCSKPRVCDRDLSAYKFFLVSSPLHFDAQLRFRFADAWATLEKIPAHKNSGSIFAWERAMNMCLSLLVTDLSGNADELFRTNPTYPFNFSMFEIR